MMQEDVMDLAFIFARTGRTIPANKWVDEIREAEADARNERALAAILG